jgi:hypothetical protein
MFASYILGGRLDSPYHPTKTKPNFQGREILINGMKAVGVKRRITDTFTMSHDVEFFAISVRSDIVIPSDHWSLTVGEQRIAKNIYCKELSEGAYFLVAHPVPAGTEFVFEFHTENADRKELEIMYHFLTDPDVDPILTGTIDTVNYPELPPEPPPDGSDPPREPPEKPNDDPCKNPITWTAFTSVSDAEDWAKSQGVLVNAGGKLDAANYITEGLTLLLNTCCGFKEMITKHTLTINIKYANGANGYFNPPTGEVVVNRGYDFNNAEFISQVEYDSGQKSSPHKLRVIIHEIGHWLHYHNLGAEGFYKVADLDSDGYGIATLLSKRDEKYVAESLCHYATKWFPIELVAETFTAKVTGVPVDPKILEWYQQYGGYEC